ncbi:MAG TPA: C4-type zinc ribbon domain-containing protein [Candidatus Hydrogenedentes bacterium]|nr:hypothetical protein [Candidatus Hydrogenedentota bacterium]HOJ69089.1 C4-type zinc ribbon domain-containing protein [Candidatus Hydrogenedentota bacterium]HOK91094.1 C4-type zinc ribbon domain-containing protein [Candidatus Hydrogenedentota bacterium]
MRGMIALQDLDLQITELEEHKLEIPRHRKAFAERLKRVDEELAECEQRFKQQQLALKECEREIETLKANILKMDVQLNTIKKNDEYSAMLNQIDLAKKQVSQKEELAIKLMCELDEGKLKLEADRKRIAEEKKRVQAEAENVENDLKALQAELDALVARRAELAKQQPPNILARYERIRAAKRFPAIVPLKDEQSCGGCFMQMRPQVINELIQNPEFKICPQCGRLIYYPAHITAGANEPTGQAEGW